VFRGVVNNKYCMVPSFLTIEGRAYLLCGSEDCSVVIWDVASEEVVLKHEHKEVPLAVAVNHQGNMVAVAGLDQNIWLYTVSP
jgi:WD40 repeat protein